MASNSIYIITNYKFKFKEKANYITINIKRI